MRGMRKPYNLSTRKTAASLTRMNNFLPLFPNGTPESKFSEAELVEILEYAIPFEWKAMFNLKGYTPSEHNKDRFITECEAIERNQQQQSNNNNNGSNKKNHEKSKFGKSGPGAKNRGQKNNAFFCKECGHNASHATVDCYKLKNKAKRAEQNAGVHNNSEGKAQAKPFSRTSFRKEVNLLARKAGKNNALDLYAAANKREQAKVKKRTSKTAKKRVASEDKDSSDSDESVQVLESPIPRKKAKVSFADKLKKQRKDLKVLDEEKAFLKKVTQAEKEEKGNATSSDSSSDEE
jgi:hypothetical protein